VKVLDPLARDRRPPSSEPAKVQLSDRDAAQSSLSGIVGHAQAAVVEEAGERGPAFETVIGRLGGLALR
jgi:hypothetical protein